MLGSVFPLQRHEGPAVQHHVLDAALRHAAHVRSLHRGRRVVPDRPRGRRRRGGHARLDPEDAEALPAALHRGRLPRRLPGHRRWHHHGALAVGVGHAAGGKPSNHSGVCVPLLFAGHDPVCGLGEGDAAVCPVVHNVGGHLHLHRPDGCRLRVAAVAAILAHRALHRGDHRWQPGDDDRHRHHGHDHRPPAGGQHGLHAAPPLHVSSAGRLRRAAARR
mmetsp:Transcript_112985/g.364785  ORF Transcript_112985/g.364785 Transcript_112985/m.364785 type:complete len:219 (+) Transcript_112985:1234-1890(+)